MRAADILVCMGEKTYSLAEVYAAIKNQRDWGREAAVNTAPTMGFAAQLA